MLGDLSPLWVSLKTVLIATAITFLAGTAAARWMARYKGKMKSVVDGLFIMPLVLPPTVVGFALLFLLGKQGPMGKLLSSLGASVVFSWPATVIAAVVMSFPLMYMTAKSGFEQVEPNLEDAARTLGASEWRVFRTITMAMAWPSIGAGIVLSFARSLGEFGATLMLAGNIPGKTTTIPVAIYFSFQGGNTRQLFLLVIVTLVISFSSIAAIACLKGRLRHG